MSLTSDELKNKLNDLELNLKDLAKLTNMSYSTVSKFGKANPVPPWVEPFLNYYSSHQSLLKIKKELNFDNASA